MPESNDAHERLLKLVRSRTEKRTEFNFGILTADRYVKTVRDAIGMQACYRHMCRTKGDWASFDDVMRKAAGTLTYSNPLMEVKSKGSSLDGWEKPKNTLMVFRHVLTTSTKDRDGDILRTKGAKPDPKMLLLFQHVHTLPIGKMLGVASHTKDELQLYSCIVDMNELCHDCAVMVDNGMGRFSHGFRALDFLEIKEGRDSTGGFDVKEFEILEESLVSVPANPDAETEEVLLSLVEGGELTSPLMKDYGQSIRERRPISIPVELDVKVSVNGQEVRSHANEPRNQAGRGAREGTSSPEETEDVSGERWTGEKTTEVEEVKREAFSCECIECGYEIESEEHCRELKCPECGGEMRRKERPGPGKALSVKLNSGGARHAQSLISAGKVKKTGSWDAPSAGMQNAYIEEHGMKAYGKWFLGIRPQADPELKAAWAYPFTSDFVNVDRSGLAAIRQRAGQQDEKDVFDAAGKLMEAIDKEEEKVYQPEGQKPYPNEHALRLNDPDKYERIRRQNDKFGPGIHAIFGITDDGKTELQAIRFSANKFTPEEAKKWLEEHDYKTDGFEPAKKPEKQLIDDTVSGGSEAVPPETDYGREDKQMVCPECNYVGPGKDSRCPECGAKLIPRKDFILEKAGRVLSKANESKIREAIDDLDEAFKMEGVPRGCKALINQAKHVLSEVMESLGEGESVEKAERRPSVKEALAIVLAEGGEEELKIMASMLKAIEDSRRDDAMVKQYMEVCSN